MSCRSLPATSAATTFARLNCTLDDGQTVSIFHMLRAETPRDAPAPDREQYQQWLQQERNFVQWHPNLTEARRASVLARLDRAIAADPVDGRTWVALQRLRGATQTATTELDRQFDRFAGRLDLSAAQVRARFERYRDDEGAQEEAGLPGYAAVNTALRGRGLPRDRATTRAFQRLERDARGAERARPREQQPRRVVREPMNSTSIAEAGYDPDGGRLELVFQSQPGRVYAYRGVPAQVWEQMQSGSAGQVYAQQVRNRRQYRYATGEAAAQDAFRQRCSRCGQFYGSAHACPPPAPVPAAPGAPTVRPVSPADVARFARGERPTPPPARPAAAPAPAATPAAPAAIRTFTPDRLSRVVDAQTGAVLDLPSRRDLLAEVAQGRTAVRVAHFNSGDPDSNAPGLYRVWGNAIYSRAEDGEVGVDTTSLRCSCREYSRSYRCEHLDGYHIALLRHVNAEAADMAAARRAQAAAQSLLAANWAASEDNAAAARARFRAEEMDPQSFLAAADAGRAAREAGEPVLDYVLDNATDGLLTPDADRGFGIEIEYVFPSDWTDEQKEAANAAISSDLWREGLIPTPRQQPYHTASDAGHYATEHENGWGHEEDGTVDGEIISPVMRDTPETWTNIEKVCDIVKRHGGMASKDTGAHVHIGAPEIGSSPAAATELARMHIAYEDTLYRFASNPDNPDGKHRGYGYCQPTDEVPMAGYQQLAQARMAHIGHHTALNYAGVEGSHKDHVEFRAWDGSLNPALIQAQVKMSAALTVAAVRNGERGAVLPREPLGSHRRRAAAGEALDAVQDSATARMFIDTLFSRPQDKAQMARLYGATRWQS